MKLILSNNPLLYFLSIDKEISEADDISLKPELLNPPFPASNSTHSKPIVVGSCKGMLCLNCQECVILWNPSTGTHHTVQEPENDYEFQKRENLRVHTVQSFGYDEINDDYKIVRLYQYMDPLYSWKKLDAKVLVYSLNSDSWKRVQDCHYFVHFRRMNDVFVNGSLHFVVSKKNLCFLGDQGDGSQYIIAGFDVSNHAFKTVASVDGGQKKFKLELGVLGRRVCAILNHDSGIYECWVLKEYGADSSWKVLFRGQMNPVNQLRLRPLSYLGGEKLVLMEAQGMILCMDVKANSLKHFKINGIKQASEISVCMESEVVLGSADTNDDKKPQQMKEEVDEGNLDIEVVQASVDDIYCHMLERVDEPQLRLLLNVMNLRKKEHSRKMKLILSDNHHLCSVSIDEEIAETDNISLKPERMNPPRPAGDDSSSKPIVVGSCRGLLCLNYQGCNILWNPSTKTHHKVPEPKDEKEFRQLKSWRVHVVQALGYDEISNDFKVLRVYQYLHPVKSLCLDDNKVLIYSLRFNSWKKVQSFSDFIHTRRITDVHVNGCLHFLGRTQTRTPSGKVVKDNYINIGSFDMSTHTYKIVLRVDVHQKKAEVVLGVLDGCLSMVKVYETGIYVCMIMKDYGANSSWSCLFRSKLNPSKRIKLEAFCWLGGHKLIFCGTPCKINCRDFEAKTSKYYVVGGNSFETLLWTDTEVDLGTDDHYRSHIPRDLVWDILVHVPTNCLMGLRRVSKVWNAIIRQHAFAKHHFLYNAFKGLVFLKLSHNPQGLHIFYANLDGSDSRAHCLWNLQHSDQVTSLVRGMIGIYNNCSFMLCSLTTRERFKLPCSFNTTSDHNYYLGYDNIGKSYKVLEFCDSKAHIFTVGSDYEWRRIDIPFTLDSHSVFIDGTLYWVVDNTIISFNMSNEQHEILPSPEGVWSLEIVAFDGRIAAITYSSQELPVVWLLERNIDGNFQEWTAHTCQVPHSNMNCVGALPSGEMLLMEQPFTNRTLIKYHISYGASIIEVNSNEVDFDGVHIYYHQESIIPLPQVLQSINSETNES